MDSAKLLAESDRRHRSAKRWWRFIPTACLVLLILLLLLGGGKKAHGATPRKGCHGVNIGQSIRVITCAEPDPVSFWTDLNVGKGGSVLLTRIVACTGGLPRHDSVKYASGQWDPPPTALEQKLVSKSIFCSVITKMKVLAGNATIAAGISVSRGTAK